MDCGWTFCVYLCLRYMFFLCLSECVCVSTCLRCILGMCDGVVGCGQLCLFVFVVVLCVCLYFWGFDICVRLC